MRSIFHSTITLSPLLGFQKAVLRPRVRYDAARAFASSPHGGILRRPYCSDSKGWHASELAHLLRNIAGILIVDCLAPQ